MNIEPSKGLAQCLLYTSYKIKELSEILTKNKLDSSECEYNLNEIKRLCDCVLVTLKEIEGVEQ